MIFPFSYGFSYDFPIFLWLFLWFSPPSHTIPIPTWRAIPEVRRRELLQQLHEVGLAARQQRPQQLHLVDLAPAPHALHVAQAVALHEVILKFTWWRTSNRIVFVG